MTDDEAEQLVPGTFLKVREDMLSEPTTNDTLTLHSVVEKHGYIFRFNEWKGDEEFTVSAKSIATGEEMEFYPEELDAVEEQE